MVGRGDGRRRPTTGINATFRPQFAVVRDPVAAVEEGELSQDGGLLQGTDLVGR